MTLVVFSDLDGTLLDHDSYSWDAARPALDALKARAVPVVLATSKTAPEVAVLHAEMQLGAAPAIVENGAGLYRPGMDLAAEAPDYARIREALAEVAPALRASFRGFGDMGAEEVAERTGLAPKAAALACQRHYSEPGIWTGSATDEAAFIAALAALSVAARRGGRFLTLSLGRTKADAMAEVAQMLGATGTIALGDAPNDTEMLTNASHGVIIKNTHGTPLPPLPGEAEGRITRTALPGPEGWNAAVLGLLSQTQDQAQEAPDG